ncbi:MULTISPECIES: polysaccharide pyruvyl transferase family protein [Lactobacillaceae]|jgi:exopolysaccharide biosynthesis predicted pyruvyltransferase EpsI|uniref:polysaccharide pyruvyl transferase family protein n=1 Tax=Lactobacillaceae TaxID=33958 RepID=UPI000DCBCAB0|nr:MULTISPECIES: polysaccharide pyruvyl transferase family protein [Lactobacillaceae]MBL3537963.1 polysaccharide pyruvyl transferase family protein [Lactobacillus sp. GPR40-2]MBL3631132.1 polysaccharide pyruvyl transferase family protein [Lactobacillus sp. GPB7-4]MBT1153778.1 polysaccharide pyruvyl transferase family protein [Lactiplantibacillus argentoratensis]MCB5233494.1 polysaccharide pyruvyl transferase family protein [Levilactobacillus brevis]MCT3397796.1 general stress protein [Lentilac
MANFYINPNNVVHELPKNNHPKFFMFGVPSYTNLGDQAISLAERKYIEAEFPDYQYIEIVEEDDDAAIPVVKQYITKQDIVAFTGGGNMGNLYLDHERARRKVFSTFTDNLTISFPQSIHFEDNEAGLYEQKLSQEAYQKNPNLVLVARDAQSYHRMQTTFNNKVIFTPDMVLYMKSVNWKFNRNGALFVLRHDSEKVVKKSTIDNIKDILGNERPVKRVDTVLDEPQKITPVTREALFDSELELFSHQEIIITDRWHAMVFSVLTGTPCLLFGNSYGKGKHAYFDWLEHINWVSYTDEEDTERIKQQINAVMEAKTHAYDLTPDFKQLHDLIAHNR